MTDLMKVCTDEAPCWECRACTYRKQFEDATERRRVAEERLEGMRGFAARAQSQLHATANALNHLLGYMRKYPSDPQGIAAEWIASVLKDPVDIPPIPEPYSGHAEPTVLTWAHGVTHHKGKVTLDVLDGTVQRQLDIPGDEADAILAMFANANLYRASTVNVPAGEEQNVIKMLVGDIEFLLGNGLPDHDHQEPAVWDNGGRPCNHCETIRAMVTRMVKLAESPDDECTECRCTRVVHRGQYCAACGVLNHGNPAHSFVGGPK